MSSFENRLALAEVLDDVHRQTIIDTLSNFGIRLANAGWNEIEGALHEQKPPCLRVRF